MYTYSHLLISIHILSVFCCSVLNVWITSWVRRLEDISATDRWVWTEITVLIQILRWIVTQNNWCHFTKGELSSLLFSLNTSMSIYESCSMSLKEVSYYVYILMYVPPTCSFYVIAYNMFFTALFIAKLSTPPPKKKKEEEEEMN